VVETPNANLVARMRWLLSSYTIRLNHRHRLIGHVFRAKGERILAEELRRLKWKEMNLREQPKGELEKLAIAARLRRETTLTIRQIAKRLHMGSWKSLNNKLYLRSTIKPKD
jgi:hypothetical protein